MSRTSRGLIPLSDKTILNLSAIWFAPLKCCTVHPATHLRIAYIASVVAKVELSTIAANVSLEHLIKGTDHTGVED